MRLTLMLLLANLANTNIQNDAKNIKKKSDK